eukprot:Rhum_TRINITY_DN14847_c18_g1::Rhum_TRINITY_DN14847_c18_g1_i1::g.125773::m.125773
MGEGIACPAEYLPGMAAVAAKGTGGRKHFRYRSEGSMTGSEGGGGSSAKSLSSWSGSTESGSSTECPEPAVGVHVRTAWQIETVQHLFALANLDWTSYHAHYCGMTGVISRFDDDDSHRSTCLLRFYNNASVGLGNELPWPLSACEPIPLPSLAAPRPKSHDPYPTLTSPSPTWQSHTGSVPAHLPAPSWAPSRFPPPHPPTSHNASLCPSFSVPSTPSTETARSDTSGNEVCLSAYVAALVVACVTARDDMRPDMPKNAPPKPEVCLGCSSLHTLKATKGQRRGNRVQSIRFECSACEAQHLQRRDTGKLSLDTRKETMALSTRVREERIFNKRVLARCPSVVPHNSTPVVPQNPYEHNLHE